MSVPHTHVGSDRRPDDLIDHTARRWHFSDRGSSWLHWSKPRFLSAMMPIRFLHQIPASHRTAPTLLISPVSNHSCWRYGPIFLLALWSFVCPVTSGSS